MSKYWKYLILGAVMFLLGAATSIVRIEKNALGGAYLRSFDFPTTRWGS